MRGRLTVSVRPKAIIICSRHIVLREMTVLQVLHTVNNHEDVGSQLLVIAGKRLHQFIFVRDNAEEAVDIMSQCSPKVSTWLKSLVGAIANAVFFLVLGSLLWQLSKLCNVLKCDFLCTKFA